jgi:hypothetical protein
MAQPQKPVKRIVLLTRDGIHRILGIFDPNADDITKMPDFITFKIDHKDGHEEKTHASLLQVQPRFILYREIMQPATGRLGEFHPQQR